jgi:hypothetical protein
VGAAALVLALAGGAAPAAAEPGAADPPTATMRPVAPDAPQLPSRIEDGSRVALPPMVIRAEPPAADNRPAYLGGGIVVLAAAFWWNRRRRDRFEREDEGGGGAAPRRAAASARVPRQARTARTRDEDADDLHAAARGDSPDLPDPPAAAEAPTRKSRP